MYVNVKFCYFKNKDFERNMNRENFESSKQSGFWKYSLKEENFEKSASFKNDKIRRGSFLTPRLKWQIQLLDLLSPALDLAYYELFDP